MSLNSYWHDLDLDDDPDVESAAVRTDIGSEVGLNARRLRKFRKSVDCFYRERIVGKTYRSDLVATYQKRFAKYQDKLFVFIDRDSVL